jgi:hypothetical protein
MTEFGPPSGSSRLFEPEPVLPQQPAPGPEAPPPGRDWRRLPEDVRTPWGWRELFLFIIIALASLFLLTNLMALGMMLLYHVKAGDLQKVLMTDATFLSLRTAIWYAFLVGYLYVTIRVNRRMPFWRTIGWHEWRSIRVPRAALYALSGRRRSCRSRRCFTTVSACCG